MSSSCILQRSKTTKIMNLQLQQIIHEAVHQHRQKKASSELLVNAKNKILSTIKSIIIICKKHNFTTLTFSPCHLWIGAHKKVKQGVFATPTIPQCYGRARSPVSGGR